MLVTACAGAPVRGTPRYLPEPVTLPEGSARLWSGVAATGPNRGGAGTFSVHRPDTRGHQHSLAELAVTLAGAPATVLEVGWMVAPSLLGDGAPRLFVHAWRGTEPCPSRCGFAPAQGPGLAPGQALEPGHSIELQLLRRDDGWWVLADGREVGRFDLAATGTSPGIAVQWFGEVLLAGRGAPAQMGSGYPPPDPLAARVDRLCVVDGAGGGCSPPARLEARPTDPWRYPVVLEGTERFDYGGPSGP